MRMDKAEYKRYIDSDAWQTKRRIVLQFYGKKCRECGKPKKVLHVHHLSYERVGREHIVDLTVLCPACHKAAHNRG